MYTVYRVHDVFVICFHSPGDGDQPRGSDDIYFIRAEKMTSSKIARDGTGLTDIINLRAMGVSFFFFWCSPPTRQLILDTCTRLLFHLSSAVNPRHPPPPLPGTCVYYYMGLTFVRRPAERFFSFSVALNSSRGLITLRHESHAHAQNIII